MPKFISRVNKFTGVHERLRRRWCDCCNRYYWPGHNFDWEYQPCVGQGEGEPEICPDCEVEMEILSRARR